MPVQSAFFVDRKLGITRIVDGDCLAQLWSPEAPTVLDGELVVSGKKKTRKKKLDIFFTLKCFVHIVFF